MDDINLRYILTRAGGAILVIVIALYAISFVKKRNRQAAIVTELKSLSSDSAFFRQFYAEDARKSLVKAVGLIAEATKAGLSAETAIDRGLGIEEKYFAMDDDKKEVPVKQALIRSTLRSNYENFRKLGYEPDYHTLEIMSKGQLPPVRTGPQAGSKAEVGTIIDPELSPGLEKVMANLEIRPPKDKDSPMTDIELAAAKQLALSLGAAGIIEKEAKEKILDALTPKAPEEGSASGGR